MDTWQQLLSEHFNKEELRDLCFELNIDDENLPERKDGFARELVRQLQREGRMEALVTAVHQQRPHLTIPDILSQQTKVSVPDELRPYLEMVARRNGRLPLGSLDPTGRESGNISLGQVFVNLSAGLQYVKDGDGHYFYEAALAHIYHQPQIILLGDPGSGKSTLLRFLAHCLANHALPAEGDGLAQLQWQVGFKQLSKETEQVVYSSRRSIEHYFEEKELRYEGWTAVAPIPIFITLRDLARTTFNPQSPLALWEFVAQQLEKEGLPQAIAPLKNQALCGEVIFLLDGVDEVPISQRADVWQAIGVLTDGPYGGNRWVATCRVLSFVNQEAPTGVPTYTLNPLHLAQIKHFIEGWYSSLAQAGELSREEAAQKTKNLQETVQRQRLRPLAENPMLLTIMAIVQTYYGTLPTERAKLYQACVETLLLRWQRHKEQSDQELPDILSQLETNQTNLERLLWEIAWQAHSQTEKRDDAADIPEIEVMQIAKKHLGSYGKAEQFLDYTERRAHLLIGRGGEDERIYTFPHRTFQEYLAACHLASGRRFPREAAKLAAESVTWREVLNLAAGTLVSNQNNREKALDGVAEVLPEKTPDTDDKTGWCRVWLAGEMAVVVGREAIEQDEVGQEILPRLQEQLVALLTNARLTPRQRAEAGNALGLIGDPRPGVCTLEPDVISIPAGSFLMGQKKTETYVDAFAIARYPVTNIQFRYFIEDGGYTDKWQQCWTSKGWLEQNWKRIIRPMRQGSTDLIDSMPVTNISWFEATAYTKWLSIKTGKDYRLPNEIEWERAARHVDGREYPWGDDWQDGIVNSSEAGVGRKTVVGSFSQGLAECGAHDMSGNIWEWVDSTMVRGGSWIHDFRYVRSLSRHYYEPRAVLDYIGFRLVKG